MLLWVLEGPYFVFPCASVLSLGVQMRIALFFFRRDLLCVSLRE